MTYKDKKCEVCDRKKEDVYVLSSILGPMSLAYCDECIINVAEPLFAFFAVLCPYDTKIPEGTDLDVQFKDWIRDLKSYYMGEYIDWNKIKELAMNYSDTYCTKNGYEG